MLVAVPLLGIRLGYLRSCYLSEVDLSGSLRCGEDHFPLLDGKAQGRGGGILSPCLLFPIFPRFPCPLLMQLVDVISACCHWHL